MKSKVTYKSGMAFAGEVNGFSVPMDTRKDLGGDESGPMPKGLLLTALGGCTGMEIVSILSKAGGNPGSLTIDIESESSDQDPRVFRKLMITYTFSGGDITREQAERAAQLSHDTYCSISAMLSKSCPIEFRIITE